MIVISIIVLGKSYIWAYEIITPKGDVELNWILVQVLTAIEN